MLVVESRVASACDGVNRARCRRFHEAMVSPCVSGQLRAGSTIQGQHEFEYSSPAIATVCGVKEESRNTSTSV